MCSDWRIYWHVCECIVLKDPISAIVCVVEEREKEKGLYKTRVFFYYYFLSSKFQPDFT